MILACGHSMRFIVAGEKGTHYCQACADEGALEADRMNEEEAKRVESRERRVRRKASGLRGERAADLVRTLVAMQGGLGRMVNELEGAMGRRAAPVRAAKAAERAVHRVWVEIEGVVRDT